MFAIVEITGKQYKISQNDKIEVDKLNKEKGKINFDKVLLYAKDEKTVELGNPYLSGATIEAEIIDSKRGEKVKVFKMKPKKRYSRTIGHRRDLSVIEIKNISYSGKKATAKPKEEEKE